MSIAQKGINTIPSKNLWQIKKTKKLKLKPVEEYKDSFHLRLYIYSHIIDISKQERGEYKGSVTTYLERYTPAECRINSKLPKLFYKKYELDILKVKTICDLYKIVDTIPSQEFFKEWDTGCDGFTFCFEIKARNQYQIKNYWSPDSYDNSSAKRITIFIDTVYNLLKLGTRHDELISTLKPGKYSNGYTILTKYDASQIKQQKRYKQSLQYIKISPDTLNKYLKTVLKELFKKDEDFYFYGGLWFKFSKYNKLIKVKPFDKFDSYQEKQEFKIFKRGVKRAYNDENLNLIVSKKSYWRYVWINTGGITIK